jgi:hypothetical protein
MQHARADYNRRIQDSDGKIGKDEPVMLFRAQDRHFLAILERYDELLNSDEKSEAPIRKAVRRQIERAKKWGETHPTKTPDVPPADVV